MAEPQGPYAGSTLQLDKGVLTFWSVVETLLNKELGSNFKFVGETLVCDHSNESF